MQGFIDNISQLIFSFVSKSVYCFSDNDLSNNTCFFINLTAFGFEHKPLREMYSGYLVCKR